MPPSSAFDIYQTASGYVAVTSDVRRTILAALAEGPRRLPELAEVTGRSKPTLSSLHMRELLSQGLVEEIADPKDARTKWYRLRATKIGSSDVPVEALREAVKRYVTASPLAARVSLAAAVDAVAAGDAGEAALRAQGFRLGMHAAAFLEGADTEALLASLGELARREGILAAPKPEAHKLRGDLVAKDAAVERVAAVLAGLLEGAAARKGFHLTVRGTARGRRVTLTASAT